MKKIAILLTSIVLSLLLFFGFFQYLDGLNQSKSNIGTVEKVDIDKNIMQYNELMNICFEELKLNMIECDKEVHKQNLSQKEPLVKKEISKSLINIIYFLLILTLIVQLYLFIHTFFFNVQMEKEMFHLSDWAINAPPILGVLGTVVAFSLLVGQGGDIQDAFSESFFEAAKTTIIGGFIYTFNLLLKSRIFLYIKGV